MTWREALQELLETMGAQRGPDDRDEDPDVRADWKAPRAEVGGTEPGEGEQAGAGRGGPPAGGDDAARTGQPPTT